MTAVRTDSQNHPMVLLDIDARWKMADHHLLMIIKDFNTTTINGTGSR